MKIVVYGTPAPQGSKRHVGRGVMIESSKKLAPWREAVKWAAYNARKGAAPLDGPLVVSMAFTLAKPQKPKSPYPDRTPDLSKLIRATEDALTDAGVWADDARVVHYEDTGKVYPNESYGALEALDVPGAVIVIRTMKERA